MIFFEGQKWTFWGQIILCPEFLRIWAISADFRYHAAVPSHTAFENFSVSRNFVKHLEIRPLFCTFRWNFGKNIYFLLRLCIPSYDAPLIFKKYIKSRDGKPTILTFCIVSRIFSFCWIIFLIVVWETYLLNSNSKMITLFDGKYLIEIGLFLAYSWNNN